MSIGDIIRKEAEKQNLTQKMVADLIGDTQQNVGNDYKKRSLTIDKLLAYSKALNHNFIKYYYETEPLKAYREEEFRPFKDEIETLENKLVELQRIISLQEETILTQKQLIDTQAMLINKDNV